MIDFAKLDDEFGGIDRSVLPLVIALNKAGFHTTGSCEGHASRPSTTAPYVLIDGKVSAGVDSNVSHMRKLLEEFYGGRKVSDDMRIIIRRGVNGLYYIHNGGKRFDAWRRMIARRVAAKRVGKSAKHIGLIDKEESALRKMALPKLQAEMKFFAKYLTQITKRK